MRTFLIFTAFAIATPIQADEKDGFAPLFDGKTLDGWTFIVKPDKDGKRADPKDTWSTVDGLIRCTGKPNGCMVTKKQYADYVLKVKFISKTWLSRA